MSAPDEEIPLRKIDGMIHVIRGKQVIFDTDLAGLYEVETKALNRAVKRNIDRFPKDFMFQLTENEFESLRCQNGTSRWGGRRYSPYVFTEQGVAMLSGVLKSKRAVIVNIEIMRAFVRYRKMLVSVEELARKVESLEQKYDSQFAVVFRAIRQLMSPPNEERKQIGFKPRKDT